MAMRALSGTLRRSSPGQPSAGIRGQSVMMASVPPSSSSGQGSSIRDLLANASSTEEEIERLLKATVRDDDVERFMDPSATSSHTTSLEPALSLRRPRGLANLGNTCFLNAAVQALGHCTPLAAYLLQGLFVADLNEANPLGTGCVIAMVFAALLHELFALRPASRSSISGYSQEDLPEAPFPPFDFLLAIAKFHPFLASGEMHDAQELFAWILGALHEDLNRVRLKSSNGAVGGTAINGEQLTEKGEERYAAEAWKQHLQSDRSVIVDLFQGQLRSQLRCPECGAVSVTFDPFLHLSLPLPAGRGPVQLADAMSLFCREEALDGDNAWQCEKCRQRVPALKKLDLWKLPPLLMIHLKRFEWVEERCGGIPYYHVRKLNCMVDLPLEGLDMSSLVAERSPQKAQLMYDLCAVVNHIGDNAEEGHYIATCRRPDGWYVFDDAYAYPLPSAEAVVCDHNYMLLFERRGTPQEPIAIREQRASEPSTWPHIVDVDWSFLSGSATDDMMAVSADTD